MKTGKILKAVVFVAGIIIMTAACNRKEEPPNLDFVVTVPAEWKYYVLTDGNVVYYAQSPLKDLNNVKDTVAEDMVISKYDAGGMSLSAFYTSYVASLANDSTFHPISTADTTINGVAAVRLIHTQTIYAVNTTTLDTVHLDAKLLKYVMRNKTFGYVVSFNALVDTYDAYKPIFDDIMKTFEFKN